MSQGLSVGFVTMLVLAAGLVLTVLGAVLAWIDRRLDEPAENRAGRKLTLFGLTLLGAGGLVLVLAVLLD